MVQPQSLLGARDAAPVRDALVSRASLVGMWLTDEQPFGASVQVCVPVLRHRVHPTAGGGPAERVPGTTVAVWWRDDPPRRLALTAGAVAGSWSPLLAVAQGVPPPAPPVPGARRVGELARCTAGFRDEFYALAEVAVEAPGPVDRRPRERAAPAGHLGDDRSRPPGMG